MANDPIHQFQISNLFEIGKIGETEIALTNSGVFMIATTVAISLFLILSTRGRTLVPGRMQLLAEMSYEFIANMVRNAAGTEGMKFFPLVFSLFMFVLFANMFGMFPYFFAVTSHIIITAALAMLVISIVLIYGFWRNGFGFLKLFVPTGIPFALKLFIVPIEIISFVSRPLSLSVRLFANILAGHITLKVFAGFIGSLSASLGLIGWIAATLPFAFAVALTGLEFLVAFLQAYVFAVLTSMYLNDAIHPGH